MNLNLTADRVDIQPINSGAIQVDLNGVDKEEILDQLELVDFLSHFTYSEILENIGMEICCDHFGLIEDTE